MPLQLLERPILSIPNNMVYLQKFFDSEEESIRANYAHADGMDFWKCEEEDLYQDYLKNKTSEE